MAATDLVEVKKSVAVETQTKVAAASALVAIFFVEYYFHLS